MLVSGLLMALAMSLTVAILGALILQLKYNLDYLTSEVSFLKENVKDFKEKVEHLSKKS